MRSAYVLSKEEQAAMRVLVYNMRAEPAMAALKALAEFHVENLKDQLVTCAPQDFAGTQGEAKGWQRVLKYLTEKPLGS